MTLNDSWWWFIMARGLSRIGISSYDLWFPHIQRYSSSWWLIVANHWSWKSGSEPETVMIPTMGVDLEPRQALKPMVDEKGLLHPMGTWTASEAMCTPTQQGSVGGCRICLPHGLCMCDWHHLTPQGLQHWPRWQFSYSEKTSICGWVIFTFGKRGSRVLNHGHLPFATLLACVISPRDRSEHRWFVLRSSLGHCCASSHPRNETVDFPQFSKKFPSVFLANQWLIVANHDDR